MIVVIAVTLVCDWVCCLKPKKEFIFILFFEIVKVGQFGPSNVVPKIEDQNGTENNYGWNKGIFIEHWLDFQ